MAQISIIIATANRTEEPLRLLSALAMQTHIPHEVIIIPGDDAIKELDMSQFPTLNIVLLPLGAVGLPRQRNRGAEAATDADVLIFFDDDFIPESNYLSAMEHEFDEDPQLLAAGGMTTEIAKPRLFARLVQRMFGLPRFAKRSYLQLTGFPALAYGIAGRRRATVFSGSNFAVRHGVWRKLRFDERLSGYAWMEDDDFSYRASQLGLVMEIPQARGEHRVASGIRGHRDPALEAFRRMRNHSYLHHKLLGGGMLLWLCKLWGQLGMVLHELMVRHSLRRAWGTLRGVFSCKPPDY